MSEYIVELSADCIWLLAECDGIHEEIVRCRDCIHLVDGDLGKDMCNLQDDVNEYHWLNVEPNGFCKWGDRRSK